MRQFTIHMVSIILNTLLLGILIGFFAGKASACESYEECIKSQSNVDTGEIPVTDGINGKVLYKTRIITYKNIEADALKAIAYKLDTIDKQNQTLITNLTLALIKCTNSLDEISKKLPNRPIPPPNELIKQCPKGNACFWDGEKVSVISSIVDKTN